MTTPIDRVREVIEGAGLSQNEFATAIGLDGPKLSKSLGGARRFTSSDYANIAELGKVTVDWLLTGQERPLAMAARRADGSSSGAAVLAARRILELRRTAVDLGYPQQAAEPYELTGSNWREQGNRLATCALEVIGGRPQSDLGEQIEASFGIDVGVTDLGDGFDGLSVASEGARIILVSPTVNAARQRFTQAHELGHLLAGDDQGVHLDKDIYAAARGGEESEVRANAFAAAFLMPQDLLTTRVTRGFDEPAFCDLVATLAVSPGALAIRLEGLRLIDNGTAERFKTLTFANAGKLSGRHAEVARLTNRSMAQRAPGLLAGDLLAAYNDGETTLRPYASLLGVDTAQARAALESEADGE